MKKAMLLLLSAALIASLSACHTAEPAPESSAPAPASSEPVLPEASAPASEPSGEATVSEESSAGAEAPASSQAPPPASSDVSKPASSNAPIPDPPASFQAEPPPMSSEPEPAAAELPAELQPYRRPFDVNRIIADMVQAGEELGMTYDESLTKEHSAWKPYDETSNYKIEDESIFQLNARGKVKSVYIYAMAVEPDTIPEQIHFRPYLEPIGNGEYNIYVFYG